VLYGAPSKASVRKRRSSALILARDLQLAGREGAPLDRLSYPTFRTVMDGLRHSSRREPGFAAPDEIVELMKGTVHWHTQEAERENTAALVRWVLLAAQAENGMELVVRNASGDAFAIRPQAAALIDTGSSWKSVRPLQDWLVHLDELRHLSNGTPVPVELLVAGFVVSIDMWIGARMFCWEFREAPLPAPAAREIEVKVCQLMHREVEWLAGLELAEGFCKRIENFVDSLDLAGIHDSTMKRTAVFRLVTALLRWLRGLPKDEVDQLSQRDPTDTHVGVAGLVPLQARLTERAGWLAIMCLRFFKDVPGRLLPEHFRELPRLAIRLRHGVASDGLPFIQDSSPQSKLNRNILYALLSTGLTPSKVLRSSSPTAVVLNALVAISGGGAAASGEDIERAESIVRGLFRFYDREIEALVTELSNQETEPALREFREILSRVLPRSGLTVSRLLPADVTSLNRALQQLLAVNKSSRTDRERASEDGGSQPAPMPTDWLVSYPTPRAGPGGAASVVVHHPWPAHGIHMDTGVQVGSFGGLVLAWGLARGFVRLDQVLPWAQGRRSTHATVRDIVGELSFKNLPVELEHTLLAFEEPG